MKYIRTYETEEKFLTDKDSTSRGFRLKPTLYKYSDVDNGIYLELDDPRKHGDSTYMEITLDSDVEFSFYIGNAPDDAQTTMTCSIDWGGGTVETKTITKDDKGFKLSHSYVAGSYKIELYDVERSYVVSGDAGSYNSLISSPESVKRVVLGSSVVSIGGYAFGYCNRLTSIHIPESVSSIGPWAFCSCSSLTSIHIPESVTLIDEGVFDSCESLTSIHIPESVTSIGDYTFEYCSSLTSIHIPGSVVSIGEYAFYECSSLTSINIPGSVTSIGEGAFSYCYSLTSVVLPNSATTPSNTFSDSGRVTIDSVSYSIGTSKLTVGNYTFNDTNFLTFYLNGNSYSYADSIDSVVVSDCDESKSGDLIIPSTISYNGTTYNVTGIGNNAFEGCSSLTSVYIPEGATSIGDYVFNGCSSLTSINIPEGVTSIGYYVFGSCSSLTSINIPEGVTSIGRGVFSGCSSLKSIDIPEKVTSIGDYAFQNCTSLTSISSLNTTAPTLGGGVFTGLPKNGTLHIKPGATGYNTWLRHLPSGWTIVEDL